MKENTAYGVTQRADKGILHHYNVYNVGLVFCTIDDPTYEAIGRPNIQRVK